MPKLAQIEQHTHLIYSNTAPSLGCVFEILNENAFNSKHHFRFGGHIDKKLLCVTKSPPLEL